MFVNAHDPRISAQANDKPSLVSMWKSTSKLKRTKPEPKNSGFFSAPRERRHLAKPGGNSAKTIVEPPRGWQVPDFNELWHYRELLYFLAWRDVKVRYKQTLIGIAWAVLQPFFTMVVFSILFGQLMRVPTQGVPYAVFTFTALLPWNFFSGALSRSSNSLIYDSNLISKVYFPRLILPFAAVPALLVDFVVAFIILIGMILFFGITPGVRVLMLPFFLLLAFLTALGVGLWLSALNLKYRDFTYLIPFLIQFWFFVTPVVYASTIIPERWQIFYSLNPMVGVIEGFRWALLGQQNLSWSSMVFSFMIILVLFVGGVLFFRHMEIEFADVV